MVEYGFAAWFSIWNSLDLLTYGLQIAIAIMYFGRLHLDSITLSILLASQILLLFWRVRGLRVPPVVFSRQHLVCLPDAITDFYLDCGCKAAP